MRKVLVIGLVALFCLSAFAEEEVDYKRKAEFYRKKAMEFQQTIREKEDEITKLHVLCREKKIDAKLADDIILMGTDFHYANIKSGTISYLNTGQKITNDHSPLVNGDVTNYSHDLNDYLKIVQIQNNNSAVVELVFSNVRSSSSRYGGESSQIGKDTLWLSGIDLTGCADGGYVKYNGPLIVEGTKQYTTAMGVSKTIKQIHPFNYDGYQIIAIRKK